MSGALTLSNNGSLASVVLPSLSTVSGALTLSNNGSLASVVLPSLETVGGGVVVRTNPVLDTVAMPCLVAVGVNAVDRDLIVETNGPGLTCDELQAFFCGIDAPPADAAQRRLEDNAGTSCSTSCDGVVAPTCG